MDQLSERKTRNGASNGKSAAYGRTKPNISSSDTKKVAFNQAVFSGRNKIRLSGISRGQFLLNESICYPYFCVARI